MSIDQRCSVLVEISIDSIYDSVPPECCVLLDNQIIFQGTVDKLTQIVHQAALDKTAHNLCLKYQNKSDTDFSQSIQIKSIRFNGIEDMKFIWIGEYCPTYPEPWATEQQQQGVALPSILTNTDYLGWAGTWTLEFTAPIFTWIHQVKNLGTIYD